MHGRASASNGGQHGKKGGAAASAPRQDGRVQEVWEGNLEEEMNKMQDVAEEYQHIALDAMLPGIVAHPCGPFGDYAGYNYQTMRCNVDLTRAIQIGLTLSDAEGKQPEGVSTWRFNFSFDADSDVVSPDLMDRLKQQFDLDKHQSQGIDVQVFGELLMSSGLVLNEDMRWISFCGAQSFASNLPDKCANGHSDLGGLPWVAFCGMYNFGHLLHLLTSQSLPDGVEGFYEILDLFFPCRCDIAKHIHQLPQLFGRDPSDPQRRPLFCNANHLLEAFFRLPDAVRLEAFDKQDDSCDVSKPQKDSEAHKERSRREPRHHASGERSVTSAPAAA